MISSELKQQPIGFFDSGIGGLSVLREALRLLPGEQYVYYADSDRAPYGTKPPEEVKRLVMEAMAFLAGFNPKAIVVACNTATSVAIDDIRKTYPDIPVIGMEPAVKPALAIAGPKRVLVFATELTLKLEKFQHLVERFDADNRIDYLPLQELVMLAERFEFEAATILPYLKAKLAPYQLDQYGAVVLGCTHFPFFIPFFKQVLPPHIAIVDGNEGTVRNLARQLGDLVQQGPGGVTYFVSGNPKEAAFFERYLKLN